MTSSEPITSYYYNRGRRVPLLRLPTTYAARYRPGERSFQPSLPVRARRFLRQDSRHQGFIPRYNLQVYQFTPRSGALVESETALDRLVQEEVRFLNRFEAIEYATPAYRQSRTSDVPMFVTNRFIVQLKAEQPDGQRGVDRLEELNRQYGVRIVGQPAYGERLYLLEVANLSEGPGAVELANTYFESGRFEFAEPDFVTRRAWKQPVATASPHEREFAAEDRVSQSLRQWHLTTARVTDAWNITRGNSSITVAILDDGVDIGHREFDGKLVGQFDFDGLIPDGTPKLDSDNHGTACASVAVAKGLTAFGAAPDCTLIAVRTPLWLAVSDEAEMFRWTADNGADVISCSWGPTDQGGPFALPDSTRQAIRYCVNEGRGGRGIPVFFAAGNGNESVSEDGYAASPEVMAIAASTSEETRAPYSDFGPEIWLCAPSNGGTRSIFTADRRGNAGYNPAEGGPADSQDYFASFGGTSSATPLVAGVAGLMLAATPELTEHQVRTILRDTADRIGDSSSYDSNGHSELYGYGRVNAQRAVARARDLVSDEGGGAPPDAGNPNEPVIQSLSDSLPRNGPPPRFRVNRGGRRFYAVEVATRAELFDADNHGDERSQSNFYGSWQDHGLLDTPTYELPSAVWQRLKSASRLYYRGHFADNSTWANYAVTISDDEAQLAPSITITGAGPEPGGSTAERTITYPSGATFEVVTVPNDGVDYNDPVADGVVPLIDIQGRRDERLAANFTVGEFAASDGARYARISPELVAGLQRLRERIGAPLIINSAYRHPALNQAVDGAEQSQHIAGRAADIRSRAVTPLELADLALEELGCTIGIGLGQNIVHVDLRGRLASWAYDGAVMDEAGFDSRVRNRCTERMSERRPRVEITRRIAPAISGPETYDAGAAPPVFRIDPGANRYYAVEVAIDWRLFEQDAGEQQRRPDTFYASWQQGLREAQSPTIFQLPAPAWEHLRRAARLYYRVLTSASGDGDWTNYIASTPDDTAGDAPWIDLVGSVGARLLDMPQPQILTPAQASQESMARWLNGHTEPGF